MTITQSFSRSNNKFSHNLNCVVTNTGENDITVKEIGLFRNCYEGTSIGNLCKTTTSDLKCIMVDRTVLNEPVIIPAGSSKTIRYKFNYNQE